MKQFSQSFPLGSSVPFNNSQKTILPRKLDPPNFSSFAISLNDNCAKPTENYYLFEKSIRTIVYITQSALSTRQTQQLVYIVKHFNEERVGTKNRAKRESLLYSYPPGALNARDC